jgi:hypothetical protein
MFFNSLLNRKEVIHMPRFDGTGPMGMGSRTGGGRGFCAPGARARYPFGWTGPVMRGAGRGGIPWGGGRGRVYGGGRGRGWCYVPYAQPFTAPDAEQEINFLKNQAAFLEQELSDVRKRLDGIETKGEN